MKDINKKDINMVYDRKTCLEEAQIARYVMHQCSAEERREMEDHLVRCPLCRSEVIFVTRNQSEIQDERKWGELPDNLYNLGMSVVCPPHVKPPVDTLEIVLRFIHDQWEIIKHTGTLIPCPVLASRGGVSQGKTLAGNIVREFDGFRVKVDIKGDTEGAASIQIMVTRATDGNLEQKVQFTLRDEQKERTLEEVTRDGEASFEGLPPGVFSIKIASQERVIGVVSLHVS